MVDSEKNLVLEGEKIYGEYFANTTNINFYLGEFFKSIDLELYVFAIFLSQIRKHHTLALFSTLRLHHIQAMMNLRQVLEAGAWAAYAIANPKHERFAETDAQGLITISDKLNDQKNKWLDANFKPGSDAIKNWKSEINRTTAHSGIVYAYRTFNFNKKERRFNAPFFDKDAFMVKADLWTVGNIALVLLDLFYGVNKERNVVKFKDDFIQRFRELESQNEKLRQELIKQPSVATCS